MCSVCKGRVGSWPVRLGRLVFCEDCADRLAEILQRRINK